jgi:hypothetical protein
MLVGNPSKFEHKYQNAFFELFLLSAIVTWLPSKVLGYSLPFLGLIWFIIRSNSGSTLARVVLFLFAYLLIVFAYFIFYLLLGMEFIIQNSFLTLLTYSSFLVFLILPRFYFSDIDFFRYIWVIKIVIVVQSALGIFQVCTFLILNGGNFDSATGDVVQGTLSPLSFLDPPSNFNNQIYTTNLLLLLLFYTPYAIIKRSGIWVCLLGFMALVVGSIWHLFISFLLALAIISLYFGLFNKKLTVSRLLAISILVIGVSLTIISQPKNFSLISHYFQKLTSNESPKATVALNSITQLPHDYPWVMIIGLGPGQYSSRAGLIGTGNYFGDFRDPKKVPFLDDLYSEAFENYVYSSWKEVSTNVSKYGNSTMARPFFSVLSIVTEFGWVFSILLLLVLGISIKKLKATYNKRITETEILRASYAYSCSVFILFFLFFSLFENYMEVPQAIFLGMVGYKYFRNYARTT